MSHAQERQARAVRAVPYAECGRWRDGAAHLACCLHCVLEQEVRKGQLASDDYSSCSNPGVAW